MAKPDYDAAAHHRILIQAVLIFGGSAGLLAYLNTELGSHDFHRMLDKIPWFGIMHGFTALGDGAFAVPVALWLAVRSSSREIWGAFLIGFAVSAFLPQLAKNVLWPDVARPYGVVAEIQYSTLLDPVYFKSFPSGHSSTGAFFALFLAFRAPSWSLIFLLTGVCVGLSRLVLHFHWVEDVVAGWAIGLCAAWLAERTLSMKFKNYGTT